MDAFWGGFEKQAGKISDAMKRVGANLPHLRKSMADQIRKNRHELLHEHGMVGASHRGKLLGSSLLANVEHGGNSVMVEHGASGLPANIIERGSSGKKFTYPGDEAGRFGKKG